MAGPLMCDFGRAAVDHPGHLALEGLVANARAAHLGEPLQGNRRERWRAREPCTHSSKIGEPVGVRMAGSEPENVNGQRGDGLPTVESLSGSSRVGTFKGVYWNDENGSMEALDRRGRGDRG